jgi:hypothetical protein
MNTRDEIKALWDEMGKLNSRINSTRQSIVPVTDPTQYAFLDTFLDASKHWAWKEFHTDANRIITENVGSLVITINPATNARLWNAINNAPKIVTGCPGWACDIVCKITAGTFNIGIYGGIYIGYDISSGGQAYMLTMRRVKTGAGVEGIIVSDINAASAHYANNLITTLPVWLRIRMTADVRYGNNFAFHYSLDGTTWTAYENIPGTPLEIFNYGGTGIGWGTGVLLSNEATLNAGSITFTLFRATRTFGPG